MEERSGQFANRVNYVSNEPDVLRSATVLDTRIISGNVLHDFGRLVSRSVVVHANKPVLITLLLNTAYGASEKARPPKGRDYGGDLSQGYQLFVNMRSLTFRGAAYRGSEDVFLPDDSEVVCAFRNN